MVLDTADGQISACCPSEELPPPLLCTQVAPDSDLLLQVVVYLSCLSLVKMFVKALPTALRLEPLASSLTKPILLS